MTTPTLHLTDSALLRDRAFIAGAWVGADDGRVFAVTNPADGDELARVPDLGAAETARAIAAAADALPEWRATTARERSRVLRRWFELVMAAQEDLARLMTAEQGKPLAESRGEVAYGAAFLEWFAEEARRVYGEVVPSPWPGKEIRVLKEPVGVVAAITPWNFPIAMITRKVGPALAAGCTAVVKPAGETPLCALALAELAARAGLPAGVLNVVTTARSSEVGKVLTGSPVVRKLSFTGSTEVGKVLMAQCAETVKRVSFELGGNAPFIVFDDADVDAAVAGAMVSKYRNTGQTCVCANRLLVQRGIHDAFVAKLGEATRALTVGPGLDGDVQQGPLINAEAVEKVERLLADAVSRGASVAVGGRRHPLGGTFFEPTVLLNANAGMALAQEEIFGPVAAVFPFDTEEEAVALANDTPYGLAAYFYARDPARIGRVAAALEYGMIGINEGIISTEVAPFGGVKESGIGREGGRWGIEEYVELKYLLVGC